MNSSLKINYENSNRIHLPKKTRYITGYQKNYVNIYFTCINLTAYWIQ